MSESRLLQWSEHALRTQMNLALAPIFYAQGRSTAVKAFAFIFGWFWTFPYILLIVWPLTLLVTAAGVWELMSEKYETP